MLNKNIKSIDDYGDILTVPEVCEILRIGNNTAYKLLKTGVIENFKIGTVRKIPKRCLVKYISEQTSGQI